MEEQRYLISDAAKIVAVEAHVLRYWEEELELSIGRTELGHRFYTRENIETFLYVKKLKEEGLQLKAIRAVLKGAGEIPVRPEEEEPETDDAYPAVVRDNTEKLQQFTALVEGIVERVVTRNNDELQSRMEESMAREMDYLIHMQEKQEEERFRRLDEAIRAHQKNSRYVAASREKRNFWRWFRR